MGFRPHLALDDPQILEKSRLLKRPSKTAQTEAGIGAGGVSLPWLRKPHTSPHSRSRRAFLLSSRTRSFFTLHIQGYFLQLLLVELLHRFLDRTDGEEQISVSLLTVLCGDAGWLCSDEASVFQHPHILAHRVALIPIVLKLGQHR